MARFRASDLLSNIGEVQAIVRNPAVKSDPLAVDVDHRLRALVQMIAEDPSLADEKWRVRRACADVVDRLERLREHSDLRELDVPAKAAHFAAQRLAEIDQQEAARILRVNARTIRAWRKSAPKKIRKDPQRIRVLAKVIYLLGSIPPWTVVSWLRQPRPELGNRSPLSLIDKDAPEAADPVMAAARGTLGQLAT